MPESSALDLGSLTALVDRELVAYCLAIEPAELETIAGGEQSATDVQLQVLTGLSAIADRYAMYPAEISAVGGAYDATARTSVANAMRLGCGGTVDAIAQTTRCCGYS